VQSRSAKPKTPASSTAQTRFWGVRSLALFREVGVLAFLAIVAAVASLVEPRFLLASNLRNILLDTPLLMIVAMGMTMVIISRNIDLSVGAMLGMSGMAVGMLFKHYPGFPVAPGVLLGILLGLLMGAVNGTLVTWLRVPAIIATLGTLSAYRGLIFILSGGRQVDPNDVPIALIRLSQTSPVGIPWLVIFALSIALAVYLFLSYHRWGRAIYAVGGNPEAARLSGIRVNATIFFTFVATGGLSGFAGVMYASRFGFVNPAQTGAGFELSVIAATVIGGTQVYGGVGSAIGTAFGCMLLAVVSNALTITGLSGQWQLAVYGAIILAALLIDSLIRRRLGRAAGETA
jgi:rhamnose transport system permease protein